MDELNDADLALIPSYRMEFLQNKINYVLDTFKYIALPIDSISLLQEVIKLRNLPILTYYYETPSSKWKTTTCFSRKTNKYIIFLNNKSFSPTTYTDLTNGTDLLFELGSILLNHYDIPESHKSEFDLKLEFIEASFFAYKLKQIHQEMSFVNV